MRREKKAGEREGEEAVRAMYQSDGLVVDGLGGSHFGCPSVYSNP